MLVLTRKVGDVIAIGDSIKIVVMAIKGKQVRLGVQADRNTAVHREEVYQRIQKELTAAMRTDVATTTAAGQWIRSSQDAEGVDHMAPLRELTSSASTQPAEKGENAKAGSRTSARKAKNSSDSE